VTDKEKVWVRQQHEARPLSVLTAVDIVQPIKVLATPFVYVFLYPQFMIANNGSV